MSDKHSKRDRSPDPALPSQGEGGAFRVLSVCTGNTCRSAMAEGILRKLAGDQASSGVAIEPMSAGTIGLTGSPATELATAVAADYGVDLTKHRSRALSAHLVAHADLILALASEHLEACRALGAERDRLFLLRSFPQHSATPRVDSIADPIGGGRREYERVFFEIDEAIRRAWPEIVRRAGAKPSR